MRIVVSRPLPGAALEELQKAGHDLLVMNPDRSAEEFLARCIGADAIITMLSDPVRADAIAKMGGQLRIIANYAVGYNNIDVEECSRRGIFVTNTPGVLTDATADVTLLLILMCMRRALESAALLRDGRFHGWRPDLMLGYDLRGKNLGIIGMGRIGEAVARRAEAFGMNILYYTRSGVKTHLPYPAVSFETVLKESDVISLHCPLTPETRHLIGRNEFGLMKKSAVIINTARGQVINEAELAEALNNGLIFYAGCDVYEDEPSVNAELLKCRNAVLLPHIGSGTVETREKMARMTVDSIMEAFAGKTPRFSVNA
ncbi:MAG: D-glycerate dehydrogenase [Candidatus Rifleibacteriota bacterium]